MANEYAEALFATKPDNVILSVSFEPRD
jgi:hypothetical protein